MKCHLYTPVVLDEWHMLNTFVFQEVKSTIFRSIPQNEAFLRRVQVKRGDLYFKCCRHGVGHANSTQAALDECELSFKR